MHLNSVAFQVMAIAILTLCSCSPEENSTNSPTYIPSDEEDEIAGTEEDEILISESAITVDSLASIVGIYDLSTDFGYLGTDISYMGIDSEGYISSYNYLGDSYQMGRNCYHIEKQWEKLSHISGNLFSSLYYGDGTVTSTDDGYLAFVIEEGSISFGRKASLFASDLLAADCG